MGERYFQEEGGGGVYMALLKKNWDLGETEWEMEGGKENLGGPRRGGEKKIPLIREGFLLCKVRGNASIGE